MSIHNRFHVSGALALPNRACCLTFWSANIGACLLPMGIMLFEDVFRCRGLLLSAGCSIMHNNRTAIIAHCFITLYAGKYTTNKKESASRR